MARGRGIEVICGRAECLPFRDGSCSAVLIVTVICFLDDPARALAEIERVLAPDGLLVIGFLERGGPVVQKYLREGGERRFLSHARFYSLADVRSLLRDAGFRVRTAESGQGFSVIAAEKGRVIPSFPT
jgi:ubiquinone/menaquinone biosynthesis C-methylase UbiE